MFDLVLLLLTSLIIGVLGLTVLLRNPKDRTYRLFALLTLFGIIWSVANYFTNHVSGYDAQVVANRISLAIGFVVIVLVWLLSLYFPIKSRPHPIQVWISVLLAPIVIILTLFSGYLVTGVTYYPDKQITYIKVGSLVYVYIISTILYFAFLTNNFTQSYRAKSTTRAQKQQIIYSATGLMLAFVWASLTSVAIPAFTNNWEISKYGPTGTLFMVVFISIAIVKHRLFDIRLVIARSLAYVLSLTTLIAFFTVATYILTNLIFSSSSPTSFQVKAVYTLTAVLLAITFSPLKRFFDQITAKVFFKDAYDPQDFLEQFNKLLVATYELGPLLKSSAEIITQNLKPTQSIFLIKNSDSKLRIIGNPGHNPISASELSANKHLFLKFGQKIIVADDLGDTHKELKKLLSRHNIAVVSRLTSSLQSEGVGYLVLGTKKTGNPFSAQDLQVVEIITNELVIAVQNALRFEEIAQFNLTLQRKVEEATRKLRVTNEKLKALDETKDDFISMASHQLRTPLTSIKGYLSMVLEGDVGKVSKQQKEMLNLAFTSSQRMVYIIADLLNVSRLKTGKFVIEKSTMYFPDIVEQELDQVEETANSREVKLIYKKPKDFPLAYLDETKTRQVIMNFIDNAIYYTPAGGKVEISLTDTPTAIEYRVKDNGLGVPKSDMPHLFTKFYRAGNARKARPDGTGLGLYMAKKVVIAQGGVVIFESTEGKGSTFGFRFAKSKVELPSGPSASDAQKTTKIPDSRTKRAEKELAATPR